jgi:RNA polymerase sigma factor (sigma-70 family)
VIDVPARQLDEGALRALVPRVLAGLVRRGEDFDAAEDALQEALLEALRVWPEHPPRDPRAWLATVATRRLVDARRSEAARQRREEETEAESPPGPTEEGDDSLFLLFCCCHPDLAPASQVALTLRAVGGLTTREIADAFYVPEATMAQRISRAKRTLQGRRLDQPGDLAVVLRVLYLVYTAGHARGDPARPPTHPRHRGTGGARAARADAPQPRPPPGAIRLGGSHRHARPPGPRPMGHA